MLGVIERGRIISGFRCRLRAGLEPGTHIGPCPDRHQFHAGLDIGGAYGSPIFAAAPGAVGRMAPDGSWGGYGNVVVLYHNDGTSSLYAHQKEFRAGLRVGQWLQQGEHLGYLGNTEAGQRGPRATSGAGMTPHVHFEALVGHPRAVRGFTTTPTSVTPQWSPMRLDPVRWLRVHNFRAFMEDSTRTRRVA